MRDKNNRVRLNSEAVQGEGSFVIIKPPSWGLLRKAQRLTANGVDAASSGVEFAEELLRSSVLAWNWTDDDDQPLPTPAEQPEVIEQMTATEVSWLVEKISNLVSAAPGN